MQHRNTCVAHLVWVLCILSKAQQVLLLRTTHPLVEPTLQTSRWLSCLDLFVRFVFRRSCSWEHISKFVFGSWTAIDGWDLEWIQFRYEQCSRFYGRDLYTLHRLLYWIFHKLLGELSPSLVQGYCGFLLRGTCINHFRSKTRRDHRSCNRHKEKALWPYVKSWLCLIPALDPIVTKS